MESTLNDNPRAPAGCAESARDLAPLPVPEPPQPPLPPAVICRRLRGECGIAGVNPSNPKLLALLGAGAQWGEFADAASAAADKGNPFAYVLATVEKRRTEATAMAGRLHIGPMPNRQEALENRNRAVADSWLREKAGGVAV